MTIGHDKTVRTYDGLSIFPIYSGETLILLRTSKVMLYQIQIQLEIWIQIRWLLLPVSFLWFSQFQLLLTYCKKVTFKKKKKKS